MSFYGFRYYSGRQTTWANSNKIAGELVSFNTQEEREKWLYEEKLSAPCGLGGGERISITRKRAIQLMGQSSFKDYCAMNAKEAGYEA